MTHQAGMLFSVSCAVVLVASCSGGSSAFVVHRQEELIDDEWREGGRGCMELGDDGSGGGVRGGPVDGPEIELYSDGDTLYFSARFNGKLLAHREFDSDLAVRGLSATVSYSLPDGRMQRYRFLGSPVCDLTLLDP